jgi:hypothetical protein
MRERKEKEKEKKNGFDLIIKRSTALLVKKSGGINKIHDAPLAFYQGCTILYPRSPAYEASTRSRTREIQPVTSRIRA